MVDTATEQKQNTTPRRIIGAVVANDFGHLLAYTCRSTMQGCEEAAEKGEFFAPGVWEKIKEKGAKVVQVEIVEVLKTTT